MCAVAISADCCFLRAIFYGQPMHTLQIGDKGLRAFATRLHEKLLPVTAATGDGNIVVIHRRLRVGNGQNLMRATVAILTIRRCLCAWLRGLGMQTVRVCRLLVGMTLSTGHFLGRGFVHCTLHVIVTIHAGEEIAVSRMLQLARIHIQADLLAVYLCGQGGVRVTGKAVFVLGLLLGVGRAGENEQG